jgi:hypothetical protein
MESSYFFLHSVVQRTEAMNLCGRWIMANAKNSVVPFITAHSGSYKGVSAHFITQASIRTMTGHHCRFFVEGIQPLLDRAHKSRLIAAP